MVILEGKEQKIRYDTILKMHVKIEKMSFKCVL